MTESVIELYDEEVLHGDEVPDAALEIAGSKWCCGFCHGRILLRIGQLPVLSPAINAVYGKSGPVIRRLRFYFTNKTASGRRPLSSSQKISKT